MMGHQSLVEQRGGGGAGITNRTDKYILCIHCYNYQLNLAVVNKMHELD